MSTDEGPAAHPVSTRPSLDPQTSIGRVQLAVSDLDRVVDFYEQVVGLRVLERVASTARLGIGSKATLIELVEQGGAPPRPAGAPGLFHLAILVPERIELARAIARVVDAGWALTGASDHLVSEALYLSDPERNGIEIYTDRPASQWRYVNGALQMATQPLDLDGVMSELESAERKDGLPTGTRIGHVHLRVADLAEAEAFYQGVLGFDVTVRSYPGALFFSAGGYHHHIGVNTWQTRPGTVATPGSRGLGWFEVALANRQELGRAKDRLAAAGIATRPHEDGVLVADPSGNGVLLTA